MFYYELDNDIYHMEYFNGRYAWIPNFPLFSLMGQETTVKQKPRHVH